MLKWQKASEQERERERVRKVVCMSKSVHMRAFEQTITNVSILQPRHKDRQTNKTKQKKKGSYSLGMDYIFSYQK